MHFLNSKPRRSLYRLRLKFEETTRVVCTDYSWSLQKVLCTYKFKYAHSLMCLRVLTKVFTSYLLWWVRRTHFLLLLSKSPNGAALPRRKVNARVVVPLLRSSFYFCPCVPRVSYRASPSFHPGLCRSIVPTALIMRLNFDAGALLKCLPETEV